MNRGRRIFQITPALRAALTGFVYCLAVLAFTLDKGTDDAVQVIAVDIRGNPLDRTRARIEITMRNVAPQIITTWGLKVTAMFPDGSSETRSLNVDEIAFLLPAQKDKAWQPGQTRTTTASVSRGVSNDLPVSAKVEVTFVVLGDDTAIGDDREIAMLQKGREARARQGMDAVIRAERELQSERPVEAFRKFVEEREKQQDSATLSFLRAFDNMLKAGAPPEKVREAVTIYREYFDLLQKHTILKRKE